MRRKKSIVPTSLPLRSTAWTRWVWVSTSGVFRLSAWLVSLALIATVVWSQWGIIQPVAASAMRNVAVVVLGEDALGPGSNSPVATVLEPASVKQMDAFVLANGYRNDLGIRRHHEIYLGDPSKSAPEKLKTVLRHPVVKA